MHVKWEDLPLVQGKTVRISLPGGFVTGKATSVEADALVVDLQKTSDPNTYPKGMLRAPRENLHRLEMQTKGKTGRAVLTTLARLRGSEEAPPYWLVTTTAFRSSALAARNTRSVSARRRLSGSRLPELP